METLSCHSSQSSYPTEIKKKHNLYTNGIYSSQPGTKVHIIAKYGTEAKNKKVLVSDYPTVCPKTPPTQTFFL